jgi:ABC-type antimicrobial peptide transport system permease subunit
MQALLAGVAPADTLTYAAAAGSSMMLALCGSVIPVFRAVRVDPVTAIKQ